MTLHFQTTWLKKSKTKIFLFLLFFVLCERFSHFYTKGFQCHKILSDLTFQKEWEVPPLHEEDLSKVKLYLNQPYHFFKMGGECYIFLSEDKQWVLKLFKHHHLRIHSPLNRIQLKGLPQRALLRILGGKEPPQERFTQLFTSCKLSYEELQPETGLIYLHLNKTNHLNQTLTLIDLIGIAHTFDLDSLEFVLQSKAELVYPTLKRLINENDLEGAKRHIHSLVQLLHTRCQKSILDTDARLATNFGFIGEKAVRIDIGRLSKNPLLEDPNACNQLIVEELAPLHQWLRDCSPPLAKYLEEQLDTRKNHILMVHCP